MKKLLNCIRWFFTVKRGDEDFPREFIDRCLHARQKIAEATEQSDLLEISKYITENIYPYSSLEIRWQFIRPLLTALEEKSKKIERQRMVHGAYTAMVHESYTAAS